MVDTNKDYISITRAQSQGSESVNLSNLSPRTIWGRVVIYMREHRYVAMHMACGDVTDVTKDNDLFVIRPEEQFLIDLLKNEDNKEILDKALKSFGVNKYVVEKKEKKISVSVLDVRKLKEIFGDKLIVK